MFDKNRKGRECGDIGIRGRKEMASTGEGGTYPLTEPSVAWFEDG
jgi:hypothetical protein